MNSVKIASSKEELDAIIALRYKILREPWNQSIDSTKDELEEKSVNAYLCDANGTILACGRLQENENKVGQVRYMAVSEEHQGKAGTTGAV